MDNWSMRPTRHEKYNSKHDNVAHADTLASFSQRMHALEGCEAGTCRTAEDGL